MENQGKRVLPNIFFVIHTRKNSLRISRSAIHSRKETVVVNATDIVNETGSLLDPGDKIIAILRKDNGTRRLAVKRIIARQQPVAHSEEHYIRSLQVCVVDKKQLLDFREINNILKDIVGITIKRDGETSMDHHLTIDYSGEDPGTRHCPFILPFLSASYPLKVDFPRVSDATKRYLRMVYPDAEVTDSRIFAFRLIHLLLHRLGYLDHFDLQERIEEHKKSRKADREGDPSQILVPDMANVCPCDWELMHFLSVQPDLPLRSFKKMLCKKCGRKRIPVGVGPKDFEAIFLDLMELAEPHSQRRTEKHIFYIIEPRNDGLVLNEAPYKSERTVNILENDWNETMFETRRNLCSIFVPSELFDEGADLRRGQKALMQVETETTPKDDEFGFVTKARLFRVEEVLRKRTTIIDPSSLLSRIRPFRLDVALKIGPGTDLDFVKSVVKIVNSLTGWHVEIDKSSYEDLRRSFDELAEVYEEWRKSEGSNRSRLVAKAKVIIDGLTPKVREVEDCFKVPVYVFPENFTFIEDIFGSIAFGRALHRIFAVVSIFPSTPPDYEKQEPCKGCRHKPRSYFREEITSLFVVHEVLHIASGLNDHRPCSMCFYGRKEMQPFRRYCCEECIREGNDQTQRSCLMSYACIHCISTRLPKSTVSQFLCEKCKKKLLPADQFAATQAARLNTLIYHRLLVQ